MEWAEASEPRVCPSAALAGPEPVARTHSTGMHGLACCRVAGATPLATPDLRARRRRQDVFNGILG
jgi:hypothetical protein